MKIKIISFDLWNTLIIYKKDSIRKSRRINYIIKIASKYKRISYQEGEQAYDNAYEELDRIWKINARTPPPEEFLEMFGRIINVTFSEEETSDITQFIQQTILEKPPRLMNGAQKILHELSKDHRLTLISNTGITIGTTLRKVLKKKGLLHKFDLTLFSNETPYGKPHPVMFEKVLSTFAVSPENVVHIGDNEEADIAGAQATGMHSILLNRDGKKKSAADFTVKNLYEIPEKIRLLEKTR